jgi:hypothetical protein
MQKNLFRTWMMLTAILALPCLALSQSGQQNSTLVVSGQPGQATVVQINGRSFVDIESLARLVNGSLSFAGNQTVLTLPGSAASEAPTAPPANPPPVPGFSKDFVKAGIEEMSTIREWRSVIVSAIQNSYPINATGLAAYSAAATKYLRLTSLAISTDSDRSAFQLLSNELDNMQMLSNKVVAKARAMEYMAPNYLDDNALNQQILSCARSLASMASSNQFVDDGSCH